MTRSSSPLKPFAKWQNTECSASISPRNTAERAETRSATSSRLKNSQRFAQQLQSSSAHTSLACYPILAYGTEEQKQKYLVPLAKGEKLGAFGLTEPNAGTDSAAQQTVAVLDGDHFVLNGSKCFITNGGYADTFIVFFAMTDKSRGNKGISAFIIEKGFKGFSIGKVEHKLGIRASSTTELVFEDCIVPKENLLGDLNKGFKIAMTTLDGGRVGVAAQALGIAEGAFNETIKYMKERIQFGKPLSAFQGLQWMVADMKCEIESSSSCFTGLQWQRTAASLSPWMLQWQSSVARKPQWMLPQSACSSTAATAIPANIRLNE